MTLGSSGRSILDRLDRLVACRICGRARYAHHAHGDPMELCTDNPYIPHYGYQFSPDVHRTLTGGRIGDFLAREEVMV